MTKSSAQQGIMSIARSICPKIVLSEYKALNKMVHVHVISGLHEHICVNYLHFCDSVLVATTQIIPYFLPFHFKATYTSSLLLVNFCATCCCFLFNGVRIEFMGPACPISYTLF